MSYFAFIGFFFAAEFFLQYDSKLPVLRNVYRPVFRSLYFLTLLVITTFVEFNMQTLVFTFQYLILQFLRISIMNLTMLLHKLVEK